MGQGRNLFRQSVAITFDDGFGNTFENAVLGLEEFGIPATFFLVTKLIGRSKEWMGS